jgi:predicted hydrocarbon binding protein
VEAAGVTPVPTANAKGAVIIGLVKFLRKNRDRALDILPAPQQRYLDEDIRLSSWYPEGDFVELIRACAKLIPLDYDAAVQSMGLAGARAHAEVYGDLLRSVKSNSSVFALWSAQHDTGELRGIWESPTTTRIELVDFAAPSREVCLLAMGYLRGGFQLNGFEDVSIEKRSCAADGAERCVWRATWKPRD